ncbi:MAG: hypothetical protein WCD44_04335 [Candidatus Babeliales bacterium]
MNSHASQEKIVTIMRDEIASNSIHAHITQETHPTLYYIIEQLTAEASIPMPKYIKFFTAQQITTDYDRYTHTGNTFLTFKNFESYVDIMGDLHLCYEVFIDSSYEEIVGIIALTIAEKANYKSLKVGGIGTSTLATLLASSYFLSKKYSLDKLFPDNYYFFNYSVMDNRIKTEMLSVSKNTMQTFATLTMGLSIFMSMQLATNYCQKQIDLEAAKLTTIDCVSKAILRVKKVKEKYKQENAFMRIMDALKLKGIWDTVIYPIRSSTPEERIQYLQQFASIT